MREGQESSPRPADGMAGKQRAASRVQDRLERECRRRAGGAGGGQSWTVLLQLQLLLLLRLRQLRQEAQHSERPAPRHKLNHVETKKSHPPLNMTTAAVRFYLKVDFSFQTRSPE